MESEWGRPEESSKTFNNKLRQFLPFAAIFVLVCIFLWKPIFRGDALLPGDYLSHMSPWNAVSKSGSNFQWNPLQWDAVAQFYPWRVFYARSMHSGHIPLWNPYQFCGTPFLANGQSAVLYPLNLIFLVFDPITAFTIFAFLHLFFAAAFTYMFLRSLGCRILGGLVGGICFAFSAFMVLWMELPTFISVAVYLPLTLLLINECVKRRSCWFGMLSGLSLALAFLAGHIQIASYIVLASILWWIWKLIEVRRANGALYAVFKVGVPFVVFAITAALISAPQMLSSVELAVNSHRASVATNFGYARFIENSLKPYRLITAFVPDYYGSPSLGNYFLGSAADYMEYGLYIGIMPILLGVMSLWWIKKRRDIIFFAVLGLVAILVALGTPINMPLYYYIPGISSLGGPNRILLLYLFSVAVLSGFGIDCFVKYSADKIKLLGRQINLGALLVLTAMIIVVMSFVLFNGVAVDYIKNLTGISFSGATGQEGITFTLFLLISVLTLLARANSKISIRLFAAVSVLLISADLFAFGINYNPTCSRQNVYPETNLTKYLKSVAGDNYIAPINSGWSLYKTPDAVLPPNAGMVYGLYDVQGYDSLYLKSYKDLSSKVQNTDSSPQENGNMVLMRHYDHGISQIADLVLTKRPLVGTKIFLLKKVDGIYIYRFAKSPNRRQNTAKYAPFSFRFGLFLMLIGVVFAFFSCTYKVLINKSKQSL